MTSSKPRTLPRSSALPTASVRTSRFAAVLAVLTVGISVGSESANAQTVLPMSRIEGPIQIDGVVDEAAWDRITPVVVTQKVPVEGAPPSQPTEIRIAYDSEYLYLSGRMFDAEPDRILANTKKRDDFTENTEWVGFLIDTYDDRENALGFWVTPTGARLDMAIANDAQGPQGINVDWNAFWDTEATRSEEGWFAEIRVPFSSLPFSQEDGRVVMGITTFRYIARTDETAAYPPRGASSGSSFRPSLTQRFAIEGVQATRSLSMVPYVLAGRAATAELNASGDAFGERIGYQRELGGDARFGIGGNVTLDLTVNTDFAQVEVDDQQVNLTRSDLFFPEKRIFFQERASLFDFSFGATDRAFHSRRIGIVDGERTRIYGGIRAVGKFGDTEGGLLTMQTQGSTSTESENFAVLRLKRRVFNENSTVGLIATSRTDLKGAYSTLYGADATVRLAGQHFLSMRWAQSFSDTDAPMSSIFDRSRLFVGLADRSPLGFTYSASWGQAGTAFDPSIGFQGRGDLQQFNSTIGYNVFPDAESRWVQYGPFANGSSAWSHTVGELESRSLQIGANGFTKSGWTGSTWVASDREVLRGPLQLAGDIVIPEGQYDFVAVSASFAAPSSFRVSGSGFFSAGEFFDGTIRTGQLAPIVTLTPDAALTLSHTLNRIQRASSVTWLALSSAKLEYYFSTTLSISAIGQHNSAADALVGSFRVRFNPRDGEDFYLVVNGDANVDRDRFVPRLPISSRHTVQVKYSRAFRPSF